MTIRHTPLRMPLKEWLPYDPIPSQRNTPAHAAKLLGKKDFKKDHPSLGHHCALVTVKEVKQTYKVNGITTTHLHVIGKAHYPSIVTGDHWFCDTMAEAQTIYKSYDPAWSGKGANDRLYSAFKAAGIELISPTFYNGKGTSGLAIAYNALIRGTLSNGAPANTEAMVQTLKRDIVAVDQLGLPRSKIGSGVLTTATALITHHVAVRGSETELEEWTAFWSAFARSKGKKEGAVTAPYNRLWGHIGDKLSSYTRGHQYEAISQALYFYSKGVTGSITAEKVTRKIDMLEYCKVKDKDTFTKMASKKTRTKKTAAAASDDDFLFDPCHE